MKLLRLPILSLALTLGGCSYGYDVKAVVIGGRLAFIVDPDSKRGASCFNEVDVTASGNARAKAAPGDDVSRVGYGTFWYERLDYDCVDKFPVFYGQQLKGKPIPLGQDRETVAAKRLQIGVVYEVTTTTGATGYGGGAFKILPDHRVINVPSPSISDTANQFESNPANGN